jgi:hypothetical protein
MSQFVFKDAYVSVGGTSLAGYVESVTIETSVDVQENTSMGDAWKKRLPSLKDFNVSVQVRNDFANGSIDETLFGLFGTEVAVEIRPTSSSVSSSNPKYTGQAILASYQPLGGNVGSMANAPIKLQGTGALTRSES